MQQLTHWQRFIHRQIDTWIAFKDGELSFLQAVYACVINIKVLLRNL